MADRISLVLAAVVAALERLTRAIETEHPATDAERLRLFRRAYREIIAAFDKLNDDEQRAVLADTQHGPLE